MIVLEKYSVEKVLNVGSKNLYETLSIVKMANNWFCWWQGKAFMSVSVQWQVISSTTGNKNCVSNIADSDILGFLFLTLHTLPSGIVPGFLFFRSIVLGLYWFVSDISCVLTSDRLLTVDTMHALCSNTKLVKETMHKGKLLGTNTTWLRKCGLMLWLMGSYFPIFSFFICSSFCHRFKPYILSQFLVLSLSIDNVVMATSKRCVKLSLIFILKCLTKFNSILLLFLLLLLLLLTFLTLLCTFITL